ncbi:MAG: efflux RND transporter permease subunit [bacterium]|nr:efflux RND transporter permease subunit [bacterium]
MKLSELSVHRPVFITSLVILMLATGFISMLRMPVDQFPNVTLPFLGVTIIYPGAGPAEMENLIAKPLEEEVRTIAGVKKVNSFSSEGVTFVWAEFALESDPDYCEQQMRDRVAIARAKMPKNIEEPLVRRYSFADQPVLTFSVQGKGTPDQLYELADRKIKPSLEQVDKVSHIKIFGGNKREIQVQLDRKKLESYELSVSQVAQALEMGGQNIPLGKRPDSKNPDKEWIYRSLGEFNSLASIQSVIVKFLGNDVPVRLAEIGQVVDTFEDETTRAFLNGRPTLIMEVYRQSGANTVAVAEDVKKVISELNTSILKQDHPDVHLTILRDGARPIRNNIADVAESIILGILLTVFVVYFFLDNFRSTIITSIAIPTSLIGAFVLVAIAGFSVNMLTLLAMSLAVGLLVDDSIVVRENIFRHLQMGKSPGKAAIDGTSEVTLAVVASTLTIVAVFGPIAYIQGITGKFLKEFGLTVCFIMFISLFDAMTIGPMLSALFMEDKKRNASRFQKLLDKTIHPLVHGFEIIQENVKDYYAKISLWTVLHPGRVLLISVAFFLASLFTLPFIPKTFLPTPDQGEMVVTLELPPGASLDATQEIADKADSIIRRNKEVDYSALVVGDENGDPTSSSVFVKLVPESKRKIRTSDFKKMLRQQLKGFEPYRVKIRDYDIMFGGERPFVMNLICSDPELLEQTALKVLEAMKMNPKFLEADLNFRPGKPELRLIYDQVKAKYLGVSTMMAGGEVRAQIEGMTPAKFRDMGEEWDIRVRLQNADRDLKRTFEQVLVPNMNYRLVNLSQVAKLVPREGPSTIFRQNSQRVIEISADMAKNTGIGDLMSWITKEMKEKKLLPPGVHYGFEGQGQQFEEMSQNMILAVVLAILFIYLVLASLYESFLKPLALLIPLPFAVSGAFIALWLGGQSLNIYSIIATVMLLGIATKNSILLIDYTNQLMAKGKKLKDALIEAGRIRLRPILMTSMTTIAGTIPLAIGLNEASRQRFSMGWVIIGGMISSTVLTLIVVPAALSFFRKKKKK